MSEQHQATVWTVTLKCGDSNNLTGVQKSPSYTPSQKGEFHYSEALLEGGGISLVQNSKQVILHIEEEAMSLLVVTIVFAVASSLLLF